jgi:hypothetical protein
MHVSVCDVFYSRFSQQHISAVFEVILLQEFKGTNVISCVAGTPYQSSLRTDYATLAPK